MSIPQGVQAIEVCESLIREHRQMEGLLEALQSALAALHPDNAESVRQAETVLRVVDADMNTHFVCEEQALFPAVSPYHPMVLMEVEHEELIALRDGLLALLPQLSGSAENAAQMRELGGRFIQEMLDHIGREDNGIFPMCERALSLDEKQTVLEGMACIRAEARLQPTPSISRPSKGFEVMQMDLQSLTERPVFSRNLLNQPGVEIKHLTVKGRESLASHWSPKEITLICVQGEGILTADARQSPLSPGTCVIMTPQLLHAITARTDCHLLLILR